MSNVRGNSGGRLGAVDFALDRDCFHIIARRRRPLYAAEVARVLRLGGILLLGGAREDDEEAGLIGFDRDEIERLFGPLGFEWCPLSPLRLESRAGGLAGWKVVLTLAACARQAKAEGSTRGAHPDELATADQTVAGTPARSTKTVCVG